MTYASAALDAAAALRHRFVGATGYGLAYGSHSAGTASATSDLDLVLISPQPLPSEQVTALVDAIQRLHHEHGLDLDDEVDYTVKVHATVADVADAVVLRCFPHDEQGRLTVPAVVVEPWFLNSDTFRLRLLLNALTSPHTFLGGGVELYEQHRRDAERAVALLALILHHGMVMTVPEAQQHLAQHADGAHGEDFLGYQAGPHLDAVLRRGMAMLADDGLVKARDGWRFDLDRAAIKAATEALVSSRA